MAKKSLPSKKLTRTAKPTRKAQATTTALARRSPQAVAIRARQPVARPAGEAPVARTLTEDIALGELGLVELKLTAAEEAILAEPVNLDDVLVKPTGQPYLSHPTYTRWLNRAFGRLGWAIVPASRPLKAEKSVVCPYILFVHGKPVAFAMGEQEYHANNKDQTYGDALEATTASALRRLTKRLGIGLELWDRRWLNNFVGTRCVMVWLEPKQAKDGEPQEKARPAYRLKTDPPFWNEKKDERRERGDKQAEEYQQTHANSDDKITQPQRQRLFVIAKKAGRDQAQVATWLKMFFNVDTSADIKRKDYDRVCSLVESSKPLRDPKEMVGGTS